MTKKDQRQKSLLFYQSPDEYGSSLAHVLMRKDNLDETIGQAWIAGPNTLATCAHVVDQFVRNPASLTVRFPASGNRYVVQSIKLHPNYKKEQDKLLKFDVATLKVELANPEVACPVLPIRYGKEIAPQQPLSAVRYPSHLEQFTTSLSPLAQIGTYLGRLRKADRIHLYHDVALASGDSGTPLLDGDTVVAMHCGDTATLPGINLPTTSIRLAVSVDALMALDVPQRGETMNIGPALVTLVVSSLIGFIAAAAILLAPLKDRWKIGDYASGLPVDITFNKPVDQYSYNDLVNINFTPRKECHLYLYYVQDKFAVALHPPPRIPIPSLARANQTVSIPHLGSIKMRADNTEGGKIHLLALKHDNPPVDKSELDEADPEICKLNISASELLQRIEKLRTEDPENVMHWQFDAPVARKEKRG